MTFVGGGVAGLVLMASALIPVPYSLYFYKQLERRGEL